MISVGIFISGIVIYIGIYAILSLSLNLKFGVTGLIDIGVVAYFVVGAYAYTLVTAAPPGEGGFYSIGLGMPWWVGFIAAALAAGVFSFLIGLPGLRLSGEYLAVATYAAAEVVVAIVTNEKWLTNGVVGYYGIPQPFRSLFGTNSDLYQIAFTVAVLVVLVGVYLLLTRLHWGPFGRALRSVRDNEDVARSVGKNVLRFRVEAFVIGGMVTGIAAALYVCFATVVMPSMFTSEITWTVWIALVIGGIGNYRGAILGAGVLIGLQEATRFFQANADLAPMLAASRFIVMGLIVILIIRYRRKGLLPERHYVDRNVVPPTSAEKVGLAANVEPMGS